MEDKYFSLVILDNVPAQDLPFTPGCVKNGHSLILPGLRKEMPQLSHQYTLRASVDQVFDFYCNPENVVRMAPPELNLHIIKADSPLCKGARVLFSTKPRLIPIEVHWLMEITDFEPGKLFVDQLVRGPFARWKHSHLFQPVEGDKTQIIDTIDFESPNPTLNRIFGTSFVLGKLEKTFSRWEDVLRQQVETEPIKN